MSFDSLPVELYESIFGYFTPQELPEVVLAVSRAIPLSPVPLHHLYHTICIKHPDQAVRVYTHLSRSQSKIDTGSSRGHSYTYLDIVTSWINEISIETWDVDAEVVINLFRLLGRSVPKLQLQSLNVWIGPRNFAPEHLEKLFVESLPTLQYLSLRFRPYVQKATYQQFLKGTYFDSTLKAIASWPTATFPALSVIQDPIDTTTLPEKRSFAQPFVFFQLDIAAFIRSPALSSLRSLRFRIPARPVARTLCSSPSPQNHINEAQPPDLRFLDLSTSGMLEGEIDLLLVRLPLLEHLILDSCGLPLSGDLHDGEWHDLGKRCALIGVQRAREREKMLKEWHELRDLSRSMADMGTAGSGAHDGRKVRPGRRGLATATISFRTPEPAVPSFVPQRRRPSVETSPAVNSPALSTTPPTALQYLSPSTSKDKKPTANKPSKPTTVKIHPSKPQSPSLSNTPASAPRLDIKLRYEPPKSKKKSGLPIAPKPPSPPQPRSSIPISASPQPVPGLEIAPEITDTQPNIKGKHKAVAKNHKATDKSTQPAEVKKKTKPTKIRVLPSLPSLLSLSISLSSSVLADRQPAIRREFEKGWVEGISQLESVRARMRISAGNGVRVMRLAPGLEPKAFSLSSDSDGDSDRNSCKESDVSSSDEGGGLEGLEDVDLSDPDAFGLNRDGVESTTLPVPILCFSGPGKHAGHVDSCGHSVAWDVMKDDQ